MLRRLSVDYITKIVVLMSKFNKIAIKIQKLHLKLLDFSSYCHDTHLIRI